MPVGEVDTLKSVSIHRTSHSRCARKKTSGYETPSRLPFGMREHQEHTNIQTPCDVCSQSWTSSDKLKDEFICSRHCRDMHNITQNCGLSRKDVYTDCSHSIESKPVFYELNLTMIMPCSGVCSSAYVCVRESDRTTWNRTRRSALSWKFLSNYLKSHGKCVGLDRVCRILVCLRLFFFFKQQFSLTTYLRELGCTVYCIFGKLFANHNEKYTHSSNRQRICPFTV